MATSHSQKNGGAKPQAALADPERALQSVLETTHEGMWTIDARDCVSFVNERMAGMLGYAVDEMIGRPIYDFLDDQTGEMVRLRLEERRRGVADQYEIKFLRKDGDERWLIVSSSPLRDEDGSYAGAFVMGTDVTRRREQEQAVKASEERYRTIIETTSEGVWMIDAEHRTTYVNARMAEMLGYYVEDMLGRPLDEFLADEDADPSDVWSRPGTGDPREVRLKRSDGSVLWGLRSGSALTDGSGGYGGALAMIADITERKRSEEGLARLAAIVESSPDAIFSTDLDARITSWNPAAERIYGYSTSEAIGMSSWELVSPNGMEAAEHVARTLQESGRVFGFLSKARHKDGRDIEIEPSVSRIVVGDGRVVGTLTIVRGPVEPTAS